MMSNDFNYDEADAAGVSEIRTRHVSHIWPFVQQAQLVAKEVTITVKFWKENHQGKALFKVK